jgi:predicted  nucleic acid-binding Zn ribbon protein
MVDDVAHWCQLENAFLQLWFDSAEYEEFAEGELINPDSPVNKEGLALRAKLETVRHCYFVFFQRFLDDIAEYEVPTQCPACRGVLISNERSRGDLLVCEECSIAFINLNGPFTLTPLEVWEMEN